MITDTVYVGMKCVDTMVQPSIRGEHLDGQCCVVPLKHETDCTTGRRACMHACVIGVHTCGSTIVYASAVNIPQI